MATLVDWTVERLLGGIREVNARAEHVQNTLRQARTDYLATLRSLPNVRDVQAREQIRAELGRWIHRQVEAENRFNAFAAAYLSAKRAAKDFLSRIGVTPPSYLGALPLVPVAIATGVAVAAATVATMLTLAAAQSRGLDAIKNVTALALRDSWTAEQTAQALEAARQATGETKPDPLGLTGTLEALLPVLLIGAAIYFLAPAIMGRKRVRA